MKTSIPRSIHVILTLLLGVAMLLQAAPARAQIALVDNELTTASPISSTSAFLLLKTNLTVSASANTVVVVMTFRNADSLLAECPATLGWTNATVSQTLTLAVQVGSEAGHGRGTAIYYLYNPTAGTGFNLVGKLTGQVGSSGDMVAYTLSGVSTSVAPLTNSEPSGAGNASFLQFNVAGVTANSWAAIGGVTAESSVIPITCTNSGAPVGTPVLTLTGSDFSSTTTASMGYISSIIFGGTETFSMSCSPAQQCSLAAAVFAPANTTFLAFGSQPQSVTIPAGQSLNATYTVSAAGNPAVTSYQWYEVGGGVTNMIIGATTTNYTTNAPTLNGTGYFVVVGNGSSSITSSVAALNISSDGTWNTSSGSWNTPGNWVGNASANGVGATASFVNDLGGTVTLDNTPGFTVGTNIFGITGAVTVQTPWIINSGSPAGNLTMAVDPSVPTSVVSGSAANTVNEMPMITVYYDNPVTINATLAGNQGLDVNGGGTLVLAGGNTNNTYSGITVIGANNADTTALQIGNGGTSGAIDFINNIFLSGYGQLIFNRSDTITVSNIIRCQAGKAPNVIVNSGTVIMAPPANINLFMGAIVNSGGTLVMDCPAGVDVVANTGGTVFTDGTPVTATSGPNGGNSGGLTLGINSGGIVRLAGPGGNGVNIQANNGVLDNGIFDLGGDAVQVGLIAGAGVVTNTGATLATLTLSGAAAPFPWNGTIADGTTAQTAVTLSGGTTAFTGPNTYTGNTILAGGVLVLSNSASLASANIRISGANLILANTPAITNPQATMSVGSGRTLDLTGLAGNFTLNAGQTLVVTNTGIVNAGANPITVIAASGSTLVPGGNGTAGTMTINANLTLNGDTNAFDLAITPTEGGGVNDEILGVTNLTLSGNITIKVNTGFNNTFHPSTSYRLIKYVGTLANTATFTVVPATLSGNSVTIDTVSLPGYILLTTGGSSPPVLSTLATNIDAFTGYPVSLPVSESGSTPITNQWFNGATAIPGATSPNYTFTPLTPGVYTYTLQATNAYGRTNATITVTVGSPTISIQCALNTAQFAGSLYLAPTDTAGAYSVSNWNVISILPSTATAAGITSTTLVDSNGMATPASFTAVNVQDGWHELLTITNTDTANARFMNTYWYANPIGGHTPVENSIVFTLTNLPNDTYDVYVYVLQQVSSGSGGPVQVYDSTDTNYVEYGEAFGSTSNLVTAINTTGTGILPYANYVKLRISTGGSNSLSFTESGTVAGVGGSGVPGVQIVPVPPSPVSIVQQPASQRVVTNTMATFTVLANGYPLAYQCYSISAARVTNAIASATNAGYTTPPVMDSDTGTGFFIVVSNVLNCVTSSTAYLTAGHMVTASGVLEDDQFQNTGLNLPYIFIDMYPGSSWMAINPPYNTEYLNTLGVVNDLPIEAPPYLPDAERIYGLFTPAVSGDYVFFVASDDAGALYLSTNNAPENSYLIAQNQLDMAAQDWTCSNTGTPEYATYYTSGEFRSDLFISGGGSGAFNQYTTGWTASPNFNYSDGGITLVAGTPYYIELDNYYGGANNQNAGVTCKLAGQPDPVSGSASLITSNSISWSVPDSVLPAPKPVITAIAFAASGLKVIIHADNGLLNARCNTLTSTNLAQWTTTAAGTFDTNGNISITNSVVPQAQAMFYQLQQLP